MVFPHDSSALPGKPFSYDLNFRGPFHIIDEQSGTSRRAANACSFISISSIAILD